MRKIVVLVAIAVLGATSNPVVAAEAPPEGRMVALGDSYTAGEGVPPFVARTDLAGINECHRSSQAYPVQVASRVGLPLESWACSGAATADLVTTTVSRDRAPWNDPLHEVTAGTSASALDRLGSDVSIVTLSIGGNDVGFADIVSDCLAEP